MSLETKILLLILGANFIVLAAELWLHRRTPEFSALSTLPTASSGMAAVAAYLITKSPAAGMWFVAGAMVLTAVKKQGMSFSFSVLGGALISSMFLGSTFFVPHSAAVFYPAVIVSFMGLGTMFLSGALRYARSHEKDSTFRTILAVLGVISLVGFFALTKWLFISGWEAVSVAVLLGTVIAVMMAVFERFLVSPVESLRDLYGASALGVGLFLAYLVAGAYGLVVASLTILAIQSAGTEGRRLAEIRRAAPQIVLSSGLMFAGYAAAASRHLYLYDWQGPIVLFIIVPLTIAVLSIKKLRKQTQ